MPSTSGTSFQLQSAIVLTILALAAGLALVTGDPRVAELAWMIGGLVAAGSCFSTPAAANSRTAAGWVVLGGLILLHAVGAVAGFLRPAGSLWIPAALFWFYLHVASPADRFERRFRIDLALGLAAFAVLACLLGRVDWSSRIVTATALATASLLVALTLERASGNQPDFGLQSSLRWLAGAALLAAALGPAELAESSPRIALALQFAVWGAIAAAAETNRSVTAGEAAFEIEPSTRLAPMLAALGTAAGGASALVSPAGSEVGLGPAMVAFAPVALVVLLLMRQFDDETAAQSESDELRQEVTRLRTLIGNVNDGVFAVDLAGRPLFVSRRLRNMFGVRASEEEQPTLDALFHPEERSRLEGQIRQCIERCRSVTGVSYRGRRLDGAEFPAEVGVSLIETGGIRLGVQVTIRDVTTERQIETSRRAMAQRLEFFFSDMPLACIIWDTDFAVQEWNAAAQRIFGFSDAEAYGKRYGELLGSQPGDPVEKAWKALAEGGSTSHQTARNRTKDGSLAECEWFHTALRDDDGEIAAIASMAQDVTDRKSLEKQLLQAQKMEALGTLAGGVAHDFNNLLTTILGNVTLTRMRLGPSHEVEQGLADAEKAAEHAAELTRQLLNFGRAGAAEVVPVVLASRLQESIDLFRRSLDGMITVESEVEEGLWAVDANAGQIAQVLMNLLVNARDAVEVCGRIQVSVRNERLDAEQSATRPWAHPGDWVVIEVSDDGCGMDETTRGRIFEPFYTTKPVGKGSGLGLSTVYGIIRNHGGGVEVSSRVGEGSTFTIYLARSMRAPARRAGNDESVALREGRETVLVADDQEDLRRLACAVLSHQGYRVIEAADGQEAVDGFLKHRDELDLVLVDLTMPHKSGRDACEEIRQYAADMPLIAASGYSADQRPYGFDEFLPKPYTAKQLLEAVQRVLGSRENV